jgi:hypothetical protein
MVLRAGGYGNVDSRGKDSPVPEPDAGFILPLYLGVTDEALYVCDSGNFRLVRLKVDYQSQETAALE